MNKSPWKPLFAILCLSLITLVAHAATYVPNITPVGDPQGNYLNVEISPDGRFATWFEAVNGSSGIGYNWHCAIDPASGNLIPTDCRGFRAFQSTTWGRGNFGRDAKGVYYVGIDQLGRLISVRPSGATSGTVNILATPPDPLRRGAYPTDLGTADGYVLFFRNEKRPGPGVRPFNDWVELQYVDLAHPTVVHIIERQQTPDHGSAPMDSGFARWMHGRALLTYGFQSARTATVGLKDFDASHPEQGAFPVIDDGVSLIDPNPISVGNFEVVLAGVNATVKSHVYQRPAGSPANVPFSLAKTFAPETSQLSTPALAQSHEPFLFNGNLYSVYQINNQGNDFWDTTFEQPGELWLANISANPVVQWRIAPDDGQSFALTEPEPFVGAGCIRIFFNRIMTNETTSQTTKLSGNGLSGDLPRFALYTADTPLVTCGR